MFPNRTVEITVQDADTTEYIPGNAAYANALNERIADYEKTKKGVNVKPADLL